MGNNLTYKYPFGFVLASCVSSTWGSARCVYSREHGLSAGFQKNSASKASNAEAQNIPRHPYDQIAIFLATTCILQMSFRRSVGKRQVSIQLCARKLRLKHVGIGTYCPYRCASTGFHTIIFGSVPSALGSTTPIGSNCQLFGHHLHFADVVPQICGQ